MLGSQFKSCHFVEFVLRVRWDTHTPYIWHFHTHLLISTAFTACNSNVSQSVGSSLAQSARQCGPKLLPTAPPTTWALATQSLWLLSPYPLPFTFAIFTIFTISTFRIWISQTGVVSFVPLHVRVRSPSFSSTFPSIQFAASRLKPYARSELSYVCLAWAWEK